MNISVSRSTRRPNMFQKNLFQSGCRKILIVALCLHAFASAAANFQLVSIIGGSNGPSVGGNGDSYLPIMTPNGRYVLFASRANNLVPTNADGPVPSYVALDAYLRDRLAGTTTLVSVSTNADGADGDSLPTGISTNGQYAIFESTADNLTPGATNLIKNVLVRDVINGITTLVSVSTNGGGGNGNSYDSSITPDGRYVVFTSEAYNLAPGGTNGVTGVFVRDLKNGTTAVASTGALVATQPSVSASPEITPDGRFVTFYSTATNLVPGVTSIGEVYVRDLVAGTTIWASTNARSLYQSIFGQVNGISCEPVISANGQFIAFEVESSNSLVSPAIVLQVNLQNLTNIMVSTNALPPPAYDQDSSYMAMTPDGVSIAYLAYYTNQRSNTSITNTIVYCWNSQSGTNFPVTVDMTTGLPAPGSCGDPAFSSSGGFLTFFSTATNLTAIQSYGENHLYLWNLQTAALEMVDTDTNGVEVGFSSEPDSAVSDDGSVVAFDLSTNNARLAPNDSNRGSEVFACNPATHSVELISGCLLPSLTPNNFVEFYPSCVSTNGRYVAFSSEANNLLDNTTNEYREIFVRDLLLGTNILVSADLNGFPATILSIEPCISGNGRYVVFSSFATNLVAGVFSNNIENIFVRDLQTGTSTLVSSNINGAPFVCGNGNSDTPSISCDGRFILYQSQSTNVSTGLPVPSPGARNLILRDQQLATNYALTSGKTTPPPGVLSACMTPDGHYVAFIGEANGVQSYLYIWDSQAATLIYTNATTGLTNVAISPDGSWIAYNNGASLWAANPTENVNSLIASGTFGSKIGLQFSLNDECLVFSSNNVIYAHDFIGGTNVLVSRHFNSTDPASGISFSPAISPNGRFVAYRSSATNIVPNSSSGHGNIYLYDRLYNVTTLISADPLGVTVANNWSMQPEFSADGSTLVFQSYASDLANEAFNEVGSIFALNLTSSASTNSTGTNTTFFARLAGFPASGQGVASGNPTVQWQAEAGNSYQVQYTTNLNNPVWQPVNGTAIIVGDNGEVIDLTPDATQRFYRIVSSSFASP